MFADTLRDLAKRLSTIPDDMTIHRNVQKVYANRAAVATADPDAKSLDWYESFHPLLVVFDGD